MPAGGQGIIAIEGRPDTPVHTLLKEVNDEAAYLSLAAERLVLKRLGFGCNAPVGVYGRINAQGSFQLALSTDLQGTLYRFEESGRPDDSLEIAERIAERLRKQMNERL